MADVSRILVTSGVARKCDRWSAAFPSSAGACKSSTLKMTEQSLIAYKPGILVLDLNLPGLGGADGLPRLQQLSPATRIIVLSDRDTESEGVAALVAGAKGYDTHAISSTALAKAVIVVQKGELWVRRAMVHALVAALAARALGPGRGQQKPERTPDRRRLDCLTLRQREVAQAIAGGASNKEIANRLQVTERTVKAHITEMFRNVGVFDRLRLALLVNDVPGGGFDAPVTPDARPAPGNSVRASSPSLRAARADTDSSN